MTSVKVHRCERVNNKQEIKELTLNKKLENLLIIICFLYVKNTLQLLMGYCTGIV